MDKKCDWHDKGKYRCGHPATVPVEWTVYILPGVPRKLVHRLCRSHAAKMVKEFGGKILEDKE